MTSYLTPKKNAAYKIYICLYDSTGAIVSNPTIASGDFKVSTDGGTVGNLATLPSVAPASSDQVMIDLSADEMNGDNVHIIYKDQTSPQAWQDGDITIHTTARQIDDLAFPTTSGRGTNLDASGNVTLAAATHTGATIPTVTTLTNAPSDSSGVTTLLTRLSAARAGYLDYLAGWSTTIFAQIAGIIDTLLATNHGSGAWGAGGNGGALSLTYTLTRSDTGAAIDGATVELYSDASMTALVSSGTTNALGVVTFSSLLAGTYYLKRIKNGYTFTNPDSEVVA